eukprot:gene9944-1794_t
MPEKKKARVSATSVVPNVPHYAMLTATPLIPTVAGYELLLNCWAALPAVSAQLLQCLGPKDALRLSSTCRSLRSTLRFTAVPSVHLCLLMRQAGQASHSDGCDHLSVPWGRCYTLHGGCVYLLAPTAFPVPFTWAAPPEDHPMLVATKKCDAVAPWCAVVEEAVCLLMDLPDPAKAAAAILDAWPRHDESTPREGPRCMPVASTNVLEVPHWPFLHDWAQARVQASRGEAQSPTSLIHVQTAAHAGLLVQLFKALGSDPGPHMMTRGSLRKLKDAYLPHALMAQCLSSHKALVVQCTCTSQQGTLCIRCGAAGHIPTPGCPADLDTVLKVAARASALGVLQALCANGGGEGNLEALFAAMAVAAKFCDVETLHFVASQLCHRQTSKPPGPATSRAVTDSKGRTCLALVCMSPYCTAELPTRLIAQGCSLAKADEDGC